MPENLGDYRDYLLILARPRIPYDPRGLVDPSDVVQITLCDALKAKPQVRDQVQTMAWLREILRCNLADAFRRFGSDRRIVSLDAELDRSSVRMAEFLRSREPAPHARLSHEEDALRVADMLGKLPEAQAEAIQLMYFEEMSVREITRQMNKGPAAIGGLLRRGMQGLRNQMSRELNNERRNTQLERP